MPIPTCRPRAASLAHFVGSLAACVCVVVLGVATPLNAQSAAGPNAETTPAAAASSVEALVVRLDQLEAEVRALRAQLAAALSAPTRPADALPGVDVQPAPQAHQHTTGDDTAAPDVPWRAPTTQIHWFSDVGFATSDRAGSTSSFGLGQLDLFLTSKLSEHWTVLSEIVFRANTDNRFVVNPERLLVQYQPSDRVQIAAGRFHSAVGYYNAAYHHGSWFETAATRPSLFAAGLVPYHNVGVTARTRVPSGPAGLDVVAEVGNGVASGSRTLEPTQSLIDEDNHKATNFAVATHPSGLPGFQAGVSWYHDGFRPTGGVPMGAHTTAAHAVYVGRGWELLNEILFVRHTAQGAAPLDSYGWYTQSAYGFGSVRPYLRYQAVHGDRADPLYGGLGHRSGPVVGVRFDLGRFAALKLQLDRSHQSATGITSHDGVFKLAFTF